MNDISDKKWSAMSDDAISWQIGKFVRHHRIEQNKTQDALAREAGISRSTLIQVLRVLDLLHVINAFTIVKQQKSPYN
ncbi:MAG: helix-turn-helix domain-containing protein [Prevotella sp.]|jgi:AraC-like DNA-binding protein|nr:helix-turn-helix domain-containing protein [Prevotella sp.]